MNPDTIGELLGVDDPYKAPDKLMRTLLDRAEREDLFRAFLDHETDVSHDWFRAYFEREHAQRKTHKQDFTPQCLSDLLSRVTSEGRKPGDNYYEVAVGTGSIMITQWNTDRYSQNPFTYKPSDWMYHVEELSDRALPFLLFNMLIRGMNGTIVHGDSLARKAKTVWQVFNRNNDFLGFSDLNAFPRTKDTEQMFNIREWEGEEIEHIETPLIDWTEWEATNRMKDLEFLKELAKFEEMRRDL